MKTYRVFTNCNNCSNNKWFMSYEDNKYINDTCLETVGEPSIRYYNNSQCKRCYKGTMIISKIYYISEDGRKEDTWQRVRNEENHKRAYPSNFRKIAMFFGLYK